MKLLEVRGITKTFHGHSVALEDVSLHVDEGETLGLVGESGSGKSTLVRCVVRLEAPDSGEILYDGMNVRKARGSELRRFRREVQMVFQDPYSSLNPRMTVEQLIAEGMIVHRLESSSGRPRQRVADLLEVVGLHPSDSERYPKSFSGGQRQRIAIARALAVRPRLLVCDEPVSALDVSVQAQVLNVLIDMQKELNLTLLFIAHNLAVVRYLSPRVAVIQKGKIVEEGPREQIFTNPQASYTKALLRAVPSGDPRLARAGART